MTKQDKAIRLSEIIIEQAIELVKYYNAKDLGTFLLHRIRVESLEIQKRIIIAEPTI
jgi:hypothetical protein